MIHLTLVLRSQKTAAMSLICHQGVPGCQQLPDTLLFRVQVSVTLDFVISLDSSWSLCFASSTGSVSSKSLKHMLPFPSYVSHLTTWPSAWVLPELLSVSPPALSISRWHWEGSSPPPLGFVLPSPVCLLSRIHCFLFVVSSNTFPINSYHSARFQSLIASTLWVFSFTFPVRK